MSIHSPSWQIVLTCLTAFGLLAICASGRAPGDWQAPRYLNVGEQMADLDRLAPDRSPVAYQAFGEALTSESPQVKGRASSWIDDLSPKGTISKTCLFQYRCYTGATRRVDVSRSIGPNSVLFTFWVTEGEVLKGNGGHGFIACP